MKGPDTVMEAVRGGADLQRECDEEEQQVSSQDTEKKKDGGHHEAADQLTEDGGNAIPVQPVNNCSPPPHNHTHSDTHSDTHSNTHTDTHSNTHSDTHSNTHNHTHNHTDTHSNTDTHNHTHRDNHTHSNTHTDTHSNTHNHTHNNTHSDTDTHTHSDTHSDTHSNTHNHTHNNTHSDTDTHTHSDTDTHTHSDTHRDTHTHTQSLTADDSVKSSGPLSFKVNGLLVSLSGGAAELKLCSHPGGSLSGFTTVQIPVTPRVHKPAETTTSPSAPPAGPAPSAPPAGPAPVITGVVSGGAAQRVVSDHSVHLRSCPWLMGKKTPCTMPTSSRKKQDTPAASHRLLEEGQQHVPPPDCPVCRSQYHFITELRGFMCLCSTAIALSLKLLKKKKRRGRSQHRRTRMFKSPRDPQISRPPGAKTQPGTPAVIHQLADDITSPTPLTSNCSPSQQDPREPPLDPHHGKLVILVDDFYYGSAPGRPRSNNVTHAGNKGPYTCIHCQSTLHNNIDLMSHLKLHMQTFEMHACRCPHCYRYFTSSFRLQCHLEAVHSQCESTAKCKICERAFGSEAAFLLHMKSRHKPGEMPYACQVCDFRSSFHSDLWSHFELSHKDTKYLLCPFCVRVISTSAFYQQHISRHQRKYVFGCDQCRLHFLYVKERIQHKQIHHRTHIKPAQLTGLKPGTKVTVRMYSLTRRSETEEGLKKSSPFKVVDVGSLPPRQEAPQRKLVESLGGLLSTLSQESMSADVSRPASLCVECLSSVQDFSSHFPSLVRCSLCSFVTCCCTAYANHMINNHAVRRMAPQYSSLFLTQPRLSEALNCVSCTFSTCRGDVMANHLTEKPDHCCIMLLNKDLPPPEETPAGEQTCDEVFAPLEEDLDGSEDQKRDLQILDQEEWRPCDSSAAAFRSSDPHSLDVSNRMFLYRLIDDRGQSHDVCNDLLLTAYSPITQTPPIRTRPPLPSVAPPADPSVPVKLEEIYQHIESFHPSVSHYSRNHSQDHRFLPTDVSLQLMYQDFAANHRTSFKRYQKAVESYNVYLGRPGEEPCELCLRQEQHMAIRHRDLKAPPPHCAICQKWAVHKERGGKGQRHFKQDAKKPQSDQLSIRRVDLQQVILLPRMPGEKAAHTTRRISAFHETFASVSQKKKSISVTWHEGVALRKAEEVASAYVVALQRERDVAHIVLWLDGCTLQNKNSCLITTMVTMVNLDSNRIQDVTLKYFEPGHTFTRSSCFHQVLEKELQRQPGGRVLDFQHFKRALSAARFGNMDVVELQNEDIRAWTEGNSRRKAMNTPPLPDLAQIQFRRGSRCMWVKLSHDPGDFIPVDFLRNKTRLTVPEPLRPSERGVAWRKKADILTNICPLMPPRSRLFWESLSENAEEEEEEEE